MGAENTDMYAPAAHYDRVHRAWELIMGEEFHYGCFAAADTPLERATDALTRSMLDRAAIGSGERVLDVGCGTGRQCCDLAAGFGTSVLGITTSAGGVTAARARAAARGLDTARFEQRDGTDNGLGDNSFDVVWVLESSHLIRDKAALLRDCVRVLAPGGRIALCDIIRKRDIPFLEVRRRRDDFALLRRAFGDAHMEPLDVYASTLAAFGMTITDATDISLPTQPTFAAWRANVDTHEDRLRQLIGDEGVTDFVRSTHVLEAFWKDETLGYGILAAVKVPSPRSRHRLERMQPMEAGEDQVHVVVTEFLGRTDKGAGGWADDTGLWGDGLGLDSLEAAELSAMLEDEFGSDPFSAGGDLPETVGDIVAFYAAVRTE